MRQISVTATLESAVIAFIDDDVLTHAAALAFYTALSFAPLIVLSLWLASSVSSSAQEAIITQIGALAGSDAKMAAAAVIENAHRRPTAGSIAGISGIVILIASATAVFAQLQSSLNAIWGIPGKPTSELQAWLRRRILSAGVLGATFFVLAISLVVSAVLGAVFDRTGYLWDLINQVVSLAVFTILFAALFRYLPDLRLGWRDTFAGAFATAALFGLGKLLIGLYFARSDIGGAYGSAGSVVVFLVWIYYSSAIFLFGAELTKAQFEKLKGAPEFDAPVSELIDTEQLRFDVAAQGLLDAAATGVGRCQGVDDVDGASEQD